MSDHGEYKEFAIAGRIIRMKHLVNPFEISGKWYKANLHTHTTTSDGGVSPAERVGQYRRAGYHVLALTDHHVTNDVRSLDDKRMLVISGMEFHPPRSGRKTDPYYHLIGLNIPHGFHFGPKEQNHANRCIAKIRRAGGLTFLGHPYWSGQEYADFGTLKGLEAMEVYNSTCDFSGRGSSENEWAYALENGMFLPAIGVDDTHRVASRDLCKCWTWLRMPALTTAGVLRAVRTGACYASLGPKIHAFGVSGGKVRLRCSPAARIVFMNGKSQGATRQAPDGKTITGFSLDLPPWPYVRAVVVDKTGRKAWANPIAL
jgi:hypothetical protein